MISKETRKEVVEYYRSRPIVGSVFVDVMGRVVGQLRSETKQQIDAVRAEVGLTAPKPTVRVPAGRGRSW
jgi:hypothetical protein